MCTAGPGLERADLESESCQALSCRHECLIIADSVPHCVCREGYTWMAARGGGGIVGECAGNIHYKGASLDKESSVGQLLCHKWTNDSFKMAEMEEEREGGGGGGESCQAPVQTVKEQTHPS